MPSVMFGSFQSSGTSPDHHSISKMVVNCPPWSASALSAFVGPSHQGPRTCGCQVFLTLAWSSLAKGKSPFKPSLSPVSWSEISEGWSCQWWPMQRQHSLTASSGSSVNRVPLPFSNRITFSLVFLLLLKYLKKPFFLSLTSLALHPCPDLMPGEP